MPRYDYCCEECFETFELRASMAKYKGYLKSHRPRCPQCGSPKTLRAFSPVNILSPKAKQPGGTAGGGCCAGGRCV